MAFCVACGYPLHDGGSFCPSCGAPVAQPVVSEVNYGETVVLNNFSNQAYPEPAAQPVMPEENYGETVVLNNNFSNQAYPEPTAQPVMPEENYGETVVLNNYSNQAYSEPAPQFPVENANSGETVLLDNVYSQMYAEQVPEKAPVPVLNENENTQSVSTQEEQQACLDNIYARLRHERLCWKIFGFAWLGYAVLFSLLGIFMPAMFIYVVMMYLPLSIINLIMIGKVDVYIKSLYNDCSLAATRCGAVGMIVFGAIFNPIAMIFIIINFTNVKTNEKTLQDIKRNQDMYNKRSW